MIKLIVTDLDGTLLTKNKEIPQEFWEIKKKLDDKNIYFALASGRQYDVMQKLFYDVKDNTIFISENGGFCVYKDKELFSIPISQNSLADLLDASKNIKSSFPVVCSKYKSYILKSTPPHMIDIFRKYISTFEMVDDLSKLNEEVLKFSLYDLNGPENNSYNYFRNLNYLDKYNIVVSGEHWLDCMDKKTNKGAAVEKLQNFLTIDRENTMVFGDYLNDYEMMDVAKYSVAMDNAHPMLKEKANYITDSNEEFGVLKAIKEFVLK